tara:strand:+ start:9026 stop:10063 length:1038 start_codon:yes stop_codon:yes gene_type:complete
MSDKKILSINMNDFSYSNNNKTKKSQPKQKPKDKIRVKNPVNKKQQTLRKQSLLNMIRKQQEERYKRLHTNTQQHEHPSHKPVNHSENISKFNSDFDNSSRTYLEQLVKKHENNVPKNTTLRRYPPIEPTISRPTENDSQFTSINNTAAPKYGCLKNGNLPTYRNYLNKTQTNRPSIQVGGDVKLDSTIPTTNNNNNNIITQQNNTTQASIIETKINDGMKRMSEIKQRNDILNKLSNNKPKQKKRRKTLRRTYKVGRSQVAPKVSVLVSNKTIRNRVSTQKQLLKQTPIQDVKKYLIKHGLIRVGSITPNDVLRQMYECLSLVCGEVQNHNPDTLLYNYINGTE